MDDDFKAEAAQFRTKAAQVREHAAQMKSDVARETLLSAARMYDSLVDKLEQRAKEMLPPVKRKVQRQ